MASRGIVGRFSSQNQAYEAAKELANLNDAGAITVIRGAMATKDKNGNLSIPDTSNVGAPWGLVGGTVIGGLLGLLLGPVGASAGAAAGAAVAGSAIGAATGGLAGGVYDLADLGLSQDFIDDVSHQMKPGETVLMGEIEEGSTEPVDSVISQHGGTVYRTDLGL